MVDTQEPKVKEKIFRIKEEEDDKLPRVIELAYELGLLEKQTFQDFMVLAINCAYTYVKREYGMRRVR